MTKTSLDRGNEIEREIDNLKCALQETSNQKMFSVRSNECGPYRTADTFLSVLDSELRKYAVQSITGQIKKLETEFKQL